MQAYKDTNFPEEISAVPPPPSLSAQTEAKPSQHLSSAWLLLLQPRLIFKPFFSHCLSSQGSTLQQISPGFLYLYPACYVVGTGASCGALRSLNPKSWEILTLTSAAFALSLRVGPLLPIKDFFIYNRGGSGWQGRGRGGVHWYTYTPPCF